MEKKFEQQFYQSLSESERLYIIDRLDNQIAWYDKKSQEAKKYFRLLRMIIVVCAALIPVASKLPYFELVATTLGVIVVVAEGFSSLFKYQEHWIEYRKICETLQHEKFMYLYHSGIYEGKGACFNFFVERIESVISKENLNWASLNNKNIKEC